MRLYSSANWKDWRDEGLMIDAAGLPDDVWYKDRFWAPEIHKIRGRYYITFNSRNESEEHEHHHACGVAVADEVTGPYKVLTHDRPLTDWPSNDLTLFEDDDGNIRTHAPTYTPQEVPIDPEMLRRFPGLAE